MAWVAQHGCQKSGKPGKPDDVPFDHVMDIVVFNVDVLGTWIDLYNFCKTDCSLVVLVPILRLVETVRDRCPQ